MSILIKVEDISKQYRLGDIGTGALAHDVNKWWHKVRGKENPYLKIGETNVRAVKGESDYVWALKDINFEVKQGEVLGIIGRNGAGKSTLLKILSKTTTPTTGSIKIKGRIASLLEVGTGFHPELTGRDNIFLNGAILGMTKREIKNKFDEIVDFAGVERYIDTPVKRYSSGMYVRLAFGVAAHLEPEILIVDEVLAVGDAEFQKKALGKMKEVSEKGGRTVLFVSHNMLAIKNICDTILVLENGYVKIKADVNEGINSYLKHNQFGKKQNNFQNKDLFSNSLVKLLSAKLITENDTVLSSDEIKICLDFTHDISGNFYLDMILRHVSGDVIFEAVTAMYKFYNDKKLQAVFTIPANILNADLFSVQFNFVSENINVLASFQNVLEFEIEEQQLIKNFYGKTAGYFKPIITSSIVSN